MKDMMPDISFERSMNHNYMILSKCNFFGNRNIGGMDYRTRMLLENHIPGLLPVTHRLVNGEGRYYYEINSLQSLERLYDKSEIRYDGLKRLLGGCVALFERLEEYLLDGSQIIMKPEFIYVDVEKMEPYFVCYPEYEGDVRLSFMEFIDGLLTRIDHTDKCAVMLGYQVYRYTRNPNYVVSKIGRIMEHVIVEMAGSGPVPAGNMAQPASGNLKQSISQTEQPGQNYAQGSYRVYDDGRCKVESNVNDDENDDEYDDEDSGAYSQKPKNIGDLIGGIFCVVISLCAGAIVLGARLISTVKLSGNNELYLCGAMGMALVAAVLFFSCYIRKRRQDEAAGEMDDEDDEDDDAYYSQPQYFNAVMTAPENTLYQKPYQSRQESTCPETVCLGDSAVEERVLCGRMNGKEVSVPLDRLPMTVGKLASVVDFVINDTAVSKMHARFEEHDGRVYVCDLNSTNGTVRNGVLLGVNQSVKLEPGDRLRFGRTCFTYC